MNPTGNVTFLFTDIEDGTKLSQQFQETYSDILERHNEILYEAVESNQGFIFKTAGDAFCCSFQNADDAVKAAVDAQIKINSEDWKEAEIRVRMGIHSGYAEWNGSDYMGYICLARTSRIMSASNGGQIIISDDAYNLYSLKVSGEISFRDLGERRLKDLNQPLKLYQIISSGIPDDFTPLKTIDARPNNLPVQITSFIGRGKEISEIKKILETSGLVTLLGAGGSGKTSLALQVGAEMTDESANGVYITEFASITDESLILQTLMNTHDIKEVKGQTQELTVTEFFKDREILLILDNCEHLIHECSNLAEMLLVNCPKLKIIATSREVLNCPGEYRYRVPSLTLPDPDAVISPSELLRFEAVRLFIERALTLNQGFRVMDENAPALIRICNQLDGIPLAIELAAARIKVLSVEKISEKLIDRFKFLTGGKRTALPRQQTLKAMMDWSYDLLSVKEKIMLQRLTVFSGGWTQESAENVCPDEMIQESEIQNLLDHLRDKSLIKLSNDGGKVRYLMLETIRKYGDELLSFSGMKEAVQEKHFYYYYNLALNSRERFMGPEQKTWIKKFDSENENLRDSINWSLKNKPELSVVISVEMAKFWELRSQFTEALEFLRKSSEYADSNEKIWKARNLYWTGFFLTNQGNYSEAKIFMKTSLEIFKELKDKEGEALVHMHLATIGLFESDYLNLFKNSEKSLAISIELNNKNFIAQNLQNTGLGLMQQGKHNEARKKLDESLLLYRELNDTVQLAKIIGNIGALYYLEGNLENSLASLEESLQLRYEIGDRQGISIALSNLGSVAYMQKDFDRSEMYLNKSLVIIRELGDKRVCVTAINTLGNIALDKGNLNTAFDLFRESVLIAMDLGDNYSIAKGFEGYSNILIKQNRYAEGCKIASRYISVLKATNKNLIEGELDRIEVTKNTFKENLSEDEFRKLWTEGESMTNENALEYMDSIKK
ncbi:MAG TPA: tetratricopeptide repeat protein [Ignavibacteria bacterium]|nr:tetratricopeptide repeat protein [Ignavibacteria bacterium]